MLMKSTLVSSEQAGQPAASLYLGEEQPKKQQKTKTNYGGVSEKTQ